MSKAQQRTWICVDDETGKRCGRSLSVRKSGAFVVVQTDDPEQCEWGGVAYLPPGAAAYAGLALIAEAIQLMPAQKAVDVAERLVRLAQEAMLRAAGWRPAAPGLEGAEDGDWTPPEDRANPWRFDLALAESRRRAESPC